MVHEDRIAVFQYARMEVALKINQNKSNYRYLKNCAANPCKIVAIVQAFSELNTRYHSTLSQMEQKVRRGHIYHWNSSTDVCLS